MNPSVTLDRQDRIAMVTLNRPETRNALSEDVVRDLLDALKACQDDASISCIILSGAGKSFCSGGNLNELIGLTRDRGLDPDSVADWYRNGIQRIPLAFHSLSVPVVAAVNGHAIGAGCDLATMADMRICDTNAVFAESFLRVGIIPGDGGTWFLPRVIGQARANEMLYTAEGIVAEKAEKWGLVSDVLEPENLMSAALAIAEKVAAQPPAAVRKAKELMTASQRLSLQESLKMAAAMQGILQQLQDHHEAINAIMEKRKPSFQGR